MSGPSSQLDNPLFEEMSTAGGVQQNFQYGIIFRSPVRRAHPLRGAMYARWYPGHEAGWRIRAEYQCNGGYFYIGRPVTDLYAANATARAQQFEDGVIYWSNGRTWMERH